MLAWPAFWPEDNAPCAPAATPARSRLAIYLDLIRWNRPAGWLLLLWPTLSALWIVGRPARLAPGAGLHARHHPHALGRLLRINDVADRDFDRHVRRTAQRPVTSGELSVREALLVGAALALLAFVLVLTTKPPTIALSFFALGVALAYPFAKRVFAMLQAVLGVAFSFGIPMAFTAALGGSDWRLSTLLAALPPVASASSRPTLFWVLAYDTECAMVDREDDLRIGIKTSAITLGKWDVAGVMASTASTSTAGRCSASRVGLGGWFLLGMAAATAQAVWHYTLIRNRRREECFKAFRQNHWLGFAVFAGTVVDLALR